MKTRIAFATVIMLTLCLASGRAQTLDTGKLDRFLDRVAEKNKGMGSVAITKDGHVAYTHAFGYSYVKGAEKKPATAATKYRIASITKMYTAVMIFQLIEEGKIRPNDTIDRFFPQIPNAKRITIAQLLNHRSGLADLQPDGSWGKQARTEEEIVARIAEGQPHFEPDAKHEYSNAGYILLGQIIEKVGGRPYREALEQRIGSKLGLRDTYYLASGTTDPGRNESVSYGYFDGWREGAEVDFSVSGPAGSIVATPTDMARFIQGLFDLKLVSAHNLKQMMTMREDEGMGMERFSFAGKPCYGHTGGSNSAGAWLAYCPEDRVALAYATNMKIYPVKDIVSGLFDIYFKRPFEIPTFEAFAVTPEVLDRYVGTYSTPDAPLKWTITRRGSVLYFQPPGNSAVPLEATAENKFTIGPGVSFEFDAAKGTLTIRRPQGERAFTKDK